MYCPSCGIELKANSKFCEYCGTEQSVSESSESSRTTYERKKIEVSVASTPHTHSQYTYTRQRDANISPKSRLAVLILWLLVGVLGIHYFYVGRIGMGILWLITGGFFGIGLVIDLILILTGDFKDSYGRRVVNWE